MCKKDYQLSKEDKNRIRSTVAFHFGFTPKDDDIEQIDKMLRNNYVALHYQQIIQELAVKSAIDDLLKYRDRIGSTEFERIWLEKNIFKYLTFASMCFKAGIPAGAISLCRTAIESGLRERLAEELARRENPNADLPEAILKKLEELRKDRLDELRRKAIAYKIINEQEFEEAFQELNLEDQKGRKILDKFIHGDIIWMVNFAKSRGSIEVRGAKDKLEEYKIISEGEISQIAIKVLKAAYRIGEILYYKNI